METLHRDLGKRPTPRFTWSTSEEHTSSNISGNGGGRQFVESSSRGKTPMQVEEEEKESDLD